jgi:hypothetical protein
MIQNGTGTYTRKLLPHCFLHYPSRFLRLNSTKYGYENYFNIDESHYTVPDANLVNVEGQLPRVKIVGGEYGNPEYEFLLPDNQTSASICFDQYIINSTSPYVYTNEVASFNELLDNLDLKEWQ